ncbi:MAG TPA: DMT family transporter [Thermoplasmata archaeon]|nr:DMT family transporter [Thermoplasmata archaeon]
MRRAPQAAILAAIVGVSFASVFIRWSFDLGASALVIAVYRLGFATLLLAPLLLTPAGRQIRTLAARDYGLMAVVGFALAAHFATWILSLQLVDVATSVVLVTSHPLLVALVSHVLFRERVTRGMAVGIGLGLVGVGMIAAAQFGQGTNTLLGSALAFLGGIAAGAYILAGRRLRQRVDLVPYATTVYAFCVLFLLLFSALAATPVVVTQNFAPLMGVLLLMAVVSQIGGHTLYNFALRHVNATVVSTSLLGEPVGASILAFLLLGEVPGCVGGACPATGLVVLGSALALFGIYLTAHPSIARDGFSP